MADDRDAVRRTAARGYATSTITARSPSTFADDSNGSDIVVLTGTAEVDESVPSEAENTAWVAKYATE